MSQKKCEYCGQEERYGHNAICVMNVVAELRAKVEQLEAENARMREGIEGCDGGTCIEALRP